MEQENSDLITIAEVGGERVSIGVKVSFETLVRVYGAVEAVLKYRTMLVTVKKLYSRVNSPRKSTTDKLVSLINLIVEANLERKYPIPVDTVYISTGKFSYPYYLQRSSNDIIPITVEKRLLDTEYPELRTFFRFTRWEDFMIGYPLEPENKRIVSMGGGLKIFSGGWLVVLSISGESVSYSFYDAPISVVFEKYITKEGGNTRSVIMTLFNPIFTGSSLVGESDRMLISKEKLESIKKPSFVIVEAFQEDIQKADIHMTPLIHRGKKYYICYEEESRASENNNLSK
jgi:hypothetical protein